MFGCVAEVTMPLLRPWAARPVPSLLLHGAASKILVQPWKASPTHQNWLAKRESRSYLERFAQLSVAWLSSRAVFSQCEIVDGRGHTLCCVFDIVWEWLMLRYAQAKEDTRQTIQKWNAAAASSSLPALTFVSRMRVLCQMSEIGSRVDAVAFHTRQWWTPVVAARHSVRRATLLPLRIWSASLVNSPQSLSNLLSPLISFDVFWYQIVPIFP